MSETKKKRTSADCNAESSQLQHKAGGHQYCISQYTRELAILNDALRDLAIEYKQLKDQEDREEAVKAEVKRQYETKPEAPKLVDTRNPSSEAKQATTQGVSEAVPTPSQVGTTEQSQKQE